MKSMEMEADGGISRVGLAKYHVASKELPCMLNRFVMRPGVQWEQARSPVVWLAV
jgi:hypothetical protein